MPLLYFVWVGKRWKFRANVRFCFSILCLSYYCDWQKHPPLEIHFKNSGFLTHSSPLLHASLLWNELQSPQGSMIPHVHVLWNSKVKELAKKYLFKITPNQEVCRLFHVRNLRLYDMKLRVWQHWLPKLSILKSRSISWLIAP